MRKHFLQIGLIAVATACGLQLIAKPAKQGVLTVETADGAELRVRLTGDESFHQYFTEDGYPLLVKGGNFYYCDLAANGDVIDSGIKAGQAEARGAAARTFLAKIDKSTLEARISARAARAPRRTSDAVAPGLAKSPVLAADGNDGPPYERGYGLFPVSRGSQFPSYGDQKAIVILVEYTDVKFHKSSDGYAVDAKDYFTRMLNENGFSDFGGTGSAAEFFRSNSQNAFRPEFDVYGPVELAHNMAYYGGNSYWGDDQRPEQMVIEACDILDDEVDFSEYDRDGDGYVDNVFIFYAGRGEASGGPDDSVWPHAWNLSSAGHSNEMHDGVTVDRYGCSNEWESGRPDGVGTFVHEFSHVIGLPDLYATSYTNSFTPGSWSAMDYGPYNNDGMTPPNYGAFERYALGWLKPREVTEALSATLQPVSENVCGVIRTPKDTEFFLLENRQQEGWDTYIPGHGMLIWHVDYAESVWNRNQVNNTPSHQYVDIEEADGTQSEMSRAGDAFPGTASKTSFTAQTSPAMKTWNNQAVNFPITNIAENDGLITFDVLGGAEAPEIPVATAAPAEDITTESFTARWEKVDGYDHLLSVYYYDEGDRSAALRVAGEDARVYLDGFKSRNVGDTDTYPVSGLEPGKVYFYTVTTSTGWYNGEASEEMPVTTGRLSLDYYAVKATEATEISDNGFTANWEALEDATDYILNVFIKVPGDPYADVNGFDNGVTAIGDWNSNSAASYGNEAYSGEAVPALRLASSQYLETPVYADKISGITFWHRGNNTTTGDQIYIYAYNADGIETLVSKVDVDKKVGGVVTTVDGFPADAVKARIVFVRTGTNGYLALDDVTAFHGSKMSPAPVEGYTDLHVGNVTSEAISGLNPATEYFYTVQATDGTHMSKVSGEISVHTGNTGVCGISDDGFAVSVSGLVVTCDSDDTIIVSDYTGALVSRGAHKVTLPRAGLYVVTVPAKNYAAKIIVK